MYQHQTASLTHTHIHPHSTVLFPIYSSAVIILRFSKIQHTVNPSVPYDWTRTHATFLFVFSFQFPAFCPQRKDYRSSLAFETTDTTKLLSLSVTPPTPSLPSDPESFILYISGFQILSSGFVHFKNKISAFIVPCVFWHLKSVLWVSFCLGVASHYPNVFSWAFTGEEATDRSVSETRHMSGQWLHLFPAVRASEFFHTFVRNAF